MQSHCHLSNWKKLQSHWQAFGTPVNHSESHYAQMENTFLRASSVFGKFFCGLTEQKSNFL